VIAIDTETTGLIPWGIKEDFGFYPARPFAVSWCDADFKTGYARFPVDPFTRQVLFHRKPKARARVQKLLGNPNTVKLFHQANFDVNMLELSGFTIEGLIIDSKTMAHIATYGGEFNYGLKPRGVKYFSYSDDDQKDLEDDVKHQRRLAEARGWCIAKHEIFGRKPWFSDYWLGDPTKCKRYAIGDVERTMLLYQFFKPAIFQNKGLKRVFERETRLYMGPVKQMEQVGMRVFPEHLDRLEKYYGEYVKEFQEKMEVIAPGFNPRSGPQRVKYFITDRGFKAPYSSEKGTPYTGGRFLKDVAATGEPLARCILEVNNTQLAVNFIKQYRLYATTESEGVKVLHPSIRQTGAATGRMSSHAPNLMNAAEEQTGRRQSHIAMKPRETLGPRPGMMWYLPDYSQIEVWLFAFISQNKAMMDALLTGQDFHGHIAKHVWSNEPTFKSKFKYWRKCAKLIMFCTLYGGGIGKLAQLIECDYPTAKKFREQHSTEMPGLKEFIMKMTLMASRDGYVANPMGRRFFIPSDKPYKAVNYVIQGCAADVLKQALVNVYFNLIAKEWSEMSVILSMHDEIILELPVEYHCKRLMRGIIHEMQSAADPIGLPVKLPVGIKICKEGDRWYKTKEIPLAT
jgi:DNA polymerase-1